MTTEWMASPVLLVVYALAAYRMTRLWIDDQLPPLPRLRTAIETKLIDRRKRQLHRRARRGEALTQADLMRRPALLSLLDCYWCAGFWVSAAAVAIASTPAEPFVRPVAVALAFSAVVAIVATKIDD